MATENPIHTLVHEHKYILKVIDALAVIDEDLSRGESIDPDLIQRVVHFMQNFADKCHHAKEEAVLFPAMEEKGIPKVGCPLGALRDEHIKGRELVASLEKAAHAYDAGEADAGVALQNAIRGIRQLYPNHIWKEDEMVFPMIERLFTSEELAKLSADFEEAESKFGQDHDRYVAFVNEISMLLEREHT